MKYLIVLIGIAGCAQYAQVKTDLIDQARRGVQMTSASLHERSLLIAKYHAQQRKLLDDAFDEDVRARDALSADWIIEHRLAYAAGLDALAAARRASDEASVSDQRTLDAIHKSL